jgi:hypothetical protein
VPDGDNTYEVESEENIVYQRWIDGLLKPNASSSSDDTPSTGIRGVVEMGANGVFELAGDSVYPVEVPISRY